MTKTTVGALDRCRAAALRTVWSQWSALGGLTGGGIVKPAAVVDLEALLLFSCALRDEEPRLWDLVGGLLAEAPYLLSVQRTRNLAASYPERVRAILPEAAAIAVRDGKDARWRPVAGRTPLPRSYRPGKLPYPARRIAEPAALLLRLRLAFGVHTRSDALTVLLAVAPSSVTARQVADATGYGPGPVRRVLDAMASAGVITAESSRPERYRADPARWPALLGDGQRPPWRHWQPLFAFLSDVLPQGSTARVADLSPYMLSSEQRRLVLSHREAFTRPRITIPDPANFPGEEYLEGFERTLDAVAEWLGESV